MKKALPTHAATIDSLQKQYEAVKIPYGEVPKEYLDVKFYLIDYKLLKFRRSSNGKSTTRPESDCMR